MAGVGVDGGGWWVRCSACTTRWGACLYWCGWWMCTVSGSTYTAFDRIDLRGELGLNAADLGVVMNLPVGNGFTGVPSA